MKTERKKDCPWEQDVVFLYKGGSGYAYVEDHLPALSIKYIRADKVKVIFESISCLCAEGPEAYALTGGTNLDVLEAVHTLAMMGCELCK